MIPGSQSDSFSQNQLELAVRFYGLGLKTSRARTRAEGSQVLSLLRDSETLAAVITADALAHVPKADILSSLKRPGAGSIPLLVLAVTPQTDPLEIANWSDGGLSGCQVLPAGSSQGAYEVGNVKEITKELSDQEIRSSTQPACTFSYDTKRGAQPLLTIRSGQYGLPIFVWDNANAASVFFLADLNTKKSFVTPVDLGRGDGFSQLAPIMMFVRYAAGEHAWHSDGHYANLTIDDAWLTEPYGHLDYAGLLAEMDKHNFHTTIAFIPWNFDRSEPNLVQLFRARADRFSICIHGDNHDHLEFGGYDRRPLARQVAAIKQALGRMEKFRILTGLPSDPVMIFPDEVVPPVETLRSLKEYGFIAAANAVTVPIGSAPPSDPLFPLRAATMNFADFPLVRRYSAEGKVSKALIAVSAFLHNPLLFYGHQNLFTDGITAFDPIAETVNQIDPNTRWTSLQFIVQHLYLVRLRDDANYDLLAFSGDLVVHNRQGRDSTFYISKEEDDSPPIKSLLVDGQSHPFTLSSGYLHVVVPVPAGGSRHLAIEYRNDLNLAVVDISKNDLHVALLRRLSDFRDLTLSQSALGRAGTYFYYNHHLDSLELEVERLLPLLLVLALCLIGATWVLSKRSRAAKLRRI